MKRARVPFLFFAFVGASALEGCGRSLDIGDIARPDGSAPASDEALPSADGGDDDAVFPNAVGDELALSAPAILPDRAVGAVRAAFDGEKHLVVWRGSRGLTAARFDLAGAILDNAPLVLAVPDAAGDGEDLPDIVVRPGGGWTVFWSGAKTLGGTALPTAALYAVNVDRDGTVGVPANGSIVAGEHARGVLSQGKDTAQPSFDVYRVLFEGNDRLVLKTYTMTAGSGLLLQGTTVVPAPGLVPGTASQIRVGARDVFAWIARSGGTDEVVISESVLPAPSVQAFAVTTTLVKEEIHTLPSSSPSSSRRGLPVQLAAAGGRAVAVWLDAQQTTGGEARVRAVSFGNAPSADVSPVKTLATGFLRDLSRRLTVAPSGADVLVGLRGLLWATPGKPVLDDVTPVAVVVEPSALATTPIAGHAAALAVEGALVGGSGAAPGSFLGLYEVEPSANVVGVVPLSIGTVVGPATNARPGLPGKTSAQTDPAVACSGDVCLAAFLDAPRGASFPHAVRLDARSGSIVDKAAFAPLAEAGDPDGHKAPFDVAARGDVLLAVGVVVADADGTCQLRGRVVKKSGAPLGALSKQALDIKSCGVVATRVIPDGQGFFALVLDREGRTTVARFGADGAPSVPVRPSIAARGADHVARAAIAAAVGDRTVVVTYDFGKWTAASFGAGSLEASPVVDLPVDLPVWAGRSAIAPVLTTRQSHATLVWSVSEDGRTGFTFKAVDLDATGRPLGAVRVLGEEPGSLGSIVSARDGEGFSLLYTRRDLEGEAFELVLRRFEGLNAQEGGRRIVARDLVTQGVGLAEVRSGQWFSAYLRYGDTFAAEGAVVVLPGARASQVFGRFLYAPTTPRETL